MISREICARVLQAAVATGADYAEIFAEHTTNHVVSMIANRVESINDTVVAGAAVRVYKGLRSVMASTVDMSEAGLLRCAESAAEALGQGTAQIDIVLKERLFGDIHPVKIAPTSCGNAEKVAVLKEGYFAAKEHDASVVQVSGNLLDVDHNILIANTEGIYTQDRQIRTRMAISAVADKGMGTQTGSCSPGRRMGLEMFDFIDPKDVAGIERGQILTEEEYDELMEDYGDDAPEAGMGAAAIQRLLATIDLDALVDTLRQEMEKTNSKQNKR